MLVDKGKLLKFLLHNVTLIFNLLVYKGTFFTFYFIESHSYYIVSRLSNILHIVTTYSNIHITLLVNKAILTTFVS